MPRKSRIDAPGTLHHIIPEGLNVRQFFRMIGQGLFLGAHRDQLGRKAEFSLGVMKQYKIT
ncbi:MAG: hypothetical protein COX51_09345 [Syntrophobacteraceae bacterium CG23_combo_of_CG06-09_8_20_14_all_50_8]|nr:MAG: hypothetical protein COX51_09345 [Syntrophobacteraceae bacterium CG23_combo_of_CG06-09_8_20_14_all_50_8]